MTRFRSSSRRPLAAAVIAAAAIAAAVIAAAVFAAAVLTACAVDDAIVELLPVRTGRPTSVASRSAPSVAPIPASADTAVALAGAVIVREADGTRRSDADATLHIAVDSRTDHSTVSVDVVEGRWQIELDRGEDGQLLGFDGAPVSVETLARTRFVLFGGMVDGRQLDIEKLDGPERVFAFGDRDADVVLRYPVPIEISVRDARTGAELDDVRLADVEARGDLYSTLGSRPGRFGPAVQIASSPVEFTSSPRVPHDDIQTVFVGSPGYAWERVEIDAYAGGTRPVMLDRGGTLEVDVRGSKGIVTELGLERRSGAECDLSTTIVGDESVFLSGLAPGRYHVSISTRARGGERRIHGLSAADVTADTIRHVIVHVQRPELDATAEQERFLPLPAAATVGEAIARTPTLALGPDAWAEVTVLFRDEDTGALAEAETLSWTRPVGDGATERTEGGVSRDPGLRAAVFREAGDDRFRMRVPVGPVRLRATGRFFSASETIIAVDGGHYELAVDADRDAAAVFRLVGGETPVPWPRSAWNVIERVDGAVVRGGRGRSGVLDMHGAVPGRYRITIPEINGFEPHPPVEVDLVAGEQREFVIELVPRR